MSSFIEEISSRSIWNIIELSSAIIPALLALFALQFYLKLTRTFLQSKKEAEREYSVLNLFYQRLLSKKEASKETERGKHIEVISSELEEKMKSSIDDYLYDQNHKKSSDWRDPLLLSRNRLLVESERLQNRSLNNLVFGVMFSTLTILALGLIFFGYFPENPYQTFSKFLASFLPKLTFILILQFTAAFFLKLHVSNENDIKQNKNEITNLELKLSAGMLSENKNSKSDIAERMACEERNLLFDQKRKPLNSDNQVELESLKSTIDALISKIPKS